MKTVFIIDTNYPQDYYFDRADGAIALHILKALGINADLRLALSKPFFEKAVKRALIRECDVMHLSCHGSDDGIGICDGDNLSWTDFAALFQTCAVAPKALVMSSCRGASDGIKVAFEQVPKRPTLIVGTTENKYPADYVAAWALLYRDFKCHDLERGAAQEALKSICAVIDESFRYWRWDAGAEKYRKFPGADKRFVVVEKATAGQ